MILVANLSREDLVCVAEEFCLIFSLYFDVIKEMLILSSQFLCFGHVITRVIVPQFLLW